MITELDPGADPRLAALFAAAAAPAELPVPGETEALAVYRRSPGKSWFTVRVGARPAQMVAAALFGGVLVAGGVATAATGSLPIVGHHRTAPASPSQDHQTGAVDAGTDGTATDTTDDTATAGPGSAGHPSVPPTLGSVAKGAETCTAASKGMCQAGQHGKAASAHDSHVPAAAGTHRAAHAPATVPAVPADRPSWRPSFLGLHASAAGVATTHRNG
jgi:hypothetical protein